MTATHTEPSAFEKHVPIPASTRASAGPRGSKWPFALMAVGDSKFYPDVKLDTIRGACWAVRTKNKAFKFVVRLVTENDAEGVRVWRVAVE